MPETFNCTLKEFGFAFLSSLKLSHTLSLLLPGRGVQVRTLKKVKALPTLDLI